MPNVWRYRGHKIAPSVAFRYITEVLKKSLNEKQKALVALWLTKGPTQYRKELDEGLLVEGATEVLVYMAKFILRLKPVRGVKEYGAEN